MLGTEFDQLSMLGGEWKGNGTGRFPTIESFKYSEQLRFTPDPAYPLIAYEQRTWLAGDESSHWESGFWRPGGDGKVEVSNAQDSGRVEVLEGHVQITDTGIEIVLHSVLHGHDLRIVRTRRSFWLNGNQLSYLVEMATRTTNTPKLQPHLMATLERQAG